MKTLKAFTAAMLPLIFAGHIQTVQAADCDRTCLSRLADELLDSMVAKKPEAAPLADQYISTENGRPAALPMIVQWRTVTAVNDRYYVIDAVTQQLFLISSINESGSKSLMFGRLKAEDGKLSEIELYTDRSRSDGGFMFDPNGLSNYPQAWLTDIPADQRATRKELLEAGLSIFDTAHISPPGAHECVLMENGRIVGEDPEVLQGLMPDADISTFVRNPDGTVAIPCGGDNPERPTDPKARTNIIDEEKGIVISMAIVEGIVYPYLATDPTESAFVPVAMLAPYQNVLKAQREAAASNAPEVKSMPANELVAQLHRIYDGKLQGMMMLQYAMPPGAGSIWVDSE